MAGTFLTLAVVQTSTAQEFNHDNPLTELGWLEGKTDPANHLTTETSTCLSETNSPEQAALSNVGEVAFRSPFLFGGLAARKKLTCHACHQHGGINKEFFISSLSDKPGNIDATNAVFSKILEDNIYNPIPIPTLYGINNKTEFGTLSPLPTKTDFVHHVIENEFDGPIPNQRIFDGLMAYIDRFEQTCSNDDNKRPRSVATDMARILKNINTAVDEWRTGNIEVANFLILTSRHELGLINERYDRTSLKKERKHLLSFSRKLEKFQQTALSTTTDPSEIYSVQKKLQRDGRKLLKRLTKKEASSYYHPDQVTQLIEYLRSE